MAETQEVRAMRISAELAKTSELLANASAPMVVAAPFAAPAGMASDVHDTLATLAEPTVRSAPAVADLSAPIADAIREPLAKG